MLSDDSKNEFNQNNNGQPNNLPNDAPLQGNFQQNGNIPPQYGQQNGNIPPQYGQQYGNVPPQYGQQNGNVPPQFGQQNGNVPPQYGQQYGNIPPQYGNNTMQPADQYGVTSMILGILSLVVCCICAFFAISYANKQNAIYPNGYSRAGKICGIISIILYSAIILFYLIFFIFAVSAGYYFNS